MMTPASLGMNPCRGDEPWLVYEGQAGPGRGKHVVLVAGDEEYRSEEALPQLAKILALRHGFRSTVLFPIDPESGIIHPNVNDNIPGLEAIETADLVILFTRFRALPDEPMRHIENYLMSGRPVLGIRTATHAFRFDQGHPWAHYGNYYESNDEWAGGFGRLVLGEKWIAHHGRHKHESTRGLIAPGAEEHPIVRGVRDGDVWGPTDVYQVRLPLPGDSKPVVLGQVVERKGEFDPDDPLYGMRPDDGPPAAGEKNNPLMPIAWTKTYQLPGGKQGRAFTSTIGASVDLLSEGTRRLLVNGAYWLVGMEEQIPSQGTDVRLVGEYRPTAYNAYKDEYWVRRALRPADVK
jgi:hypothetical protein